jgi:hypothetical protein
MNLEKPPERANHGTEREEGGEREREIKVLIADEKKRSNEAASSNNLASLTVD